jgi:hypothetical protein
MERILMYRLALRAESRSAVARNYQRHKPPAVRSPLLRLRSASGP